MWKGQLSITHNSRKTNYLPFLLMQTHPKTTGNGSVLIKMANYLYNSSYEPLKSDLSSSQYSVTMSIDGKRLI